MFRITPELYDAIYSFKDYAAESEQIRQLIRDNCPGARAILDVACGTAEHARHLAAHFHVDGIDIDPAFVKSAQTKNPAGVFHVADMRSFQLNKRYDVVQCLFSSIGYLLKPDEIVAALKCFRGHVTHDGIVLVEPWISPANYKPPAPHMKTVDRPNLKACRMEVPQREGDISILHFHYLIATVAGIQHIEETHRLLMIPPEQMTSHFQSAGFACRFDPVGIFGRGLFIARPLS
jgi:SAM-dependent methyltransferase